MNRRDIEDRFKRSKSQRQTWEQQWEDCMDYAMPARQSFYSRGRGLQRMDRVFDETAIMATAEFASRMQGAITPPGRRWFRLVVGEEMDRMAAKQLQAGLDEVGEFLYRMFLQSNFDAEIHENYMDIAIGTCAMYMDLDDMNRLNFKALPLPTVWIDEGPDGRVDALFREQPRQTPDMIFARYGKLPEGMKSDSRKEYTVNECSLRDWNDRANEKYIYRRWVHGFEGWLVDRNHTGWGSNPMISCRWSETPDEWYGRGPLINLLPAIRSANLIRELIFENAEMAIGGVFQYPNDGTINPDQIRIAPNTFIPKMPGTEGITPLRTFSDFNVAEANLQDLRQVIRRGLFSEEFTPTGRTPLSAQEIAARQADLAQRIGSPFARIMKELVEPVVKRAARLYMNAGMIELPKIDGRNIKVISVSPLARAQSAEDITRAMTFIQSVTSVMGPQAAGTYIKDEETVQYLASLYEYPMKLLHDNQSRRQAAERARELGQMLEGAMQPTPQESSRQVIEKGELQPLA